MGGSPYFQSPTHRVHPNDPLPQRTFWSTRTCRGLLVARGSNSTWCELLVCKLHNSAGLQNVPGPAVVALSILAPSTRRAKGLVDGFPLNQQNP